MRWTLAILLTISLLLLGCASHETKIRVGILPIEDALPIVVGVEEGVFKKYGLEVEVVNFNSALERDAALLAGEVDAVITDPLAIILLRNQGYDVRITSLCLGKTPEEGVFAILAAPNSDIWKVEDLEGRQIAISSNTIIEYVTDMILSKYGITYEKMEVKQIPTRLRMLLDGKVEAATLPEPLASFAVSKGARLIVSDAMLDESVTQTVIAFRGEVVDKNKDAIRKLFKAYAEAVKEINSNPEKYRKKFIEIARVPEEISESYKMPKYPEPEKFPEEFYLKYLNWAYRKGLISKEIPYEEAVYDIGQ